MCVSLCPACGRETTPTPSTTAAQRQTQTQTHKLPNIQHKVPPRQLLHRHCKPRKLEEITANPGGANVAMVMMMTMMMHHRPGSSLHTQTLFSLSLSSSLRNTHSGFVQNPPSLSQQHHSVTLPCLSSSTTTSSFQLRIATQIYNLRPWHIL